MSYSFIDLFAGAGGLSLGFELAGFKSVLAIEADLWAAASYRANHQHSNVQTRDIEDITDEEIESARAYRPVAVVGGPPCQGFSHSNIVNRDPKDPRNSLFEQFVRFMRIVRPPLGVIENVPGLLTATTATGQSVLSLIESEFRSIGYDCEWRVLEASAFGVPQRRQRLFIVALDRNRLPTFSWPQASHGPTEAPDLFGRQQLSPLVTLWDAISDLPQITAETFEEGATYRCPPQNTYQELVREGATGPILHHEPMKHTPRIIERFKAISFGLSESDVPAELQPKRRGKPDELSGKAYGQNSRRQDPHRPCSTIVASSHTNFIHPFLDRNFTVRELMRIQSFPDSYVLCGKRAVLSRKLSLRKGLMDDIFLDQRTQIGNAVPPLLARAIGEAAMALLSEVKSNAA